MTRIEQMIIDEYNRVTELFKFNDFYAMPRQYKTPAYNYTSDIEKLPYGKFTFGNYDDNMHEDITLLQPIKDIHEAMFSLMSLQFRIDKKIIAFDKGITYIDNILIYGISYSTKETFILTEKHFDPQEVLNCKDEPYIDIEYKFKNTFLRG